MTSSPHDYKRDLHKGDYEIMSYYKEWPLLELLETRSFPSHTCNPVIYNSDHYRNLLNAKTILSLYGYRKHKLYFDVVVKDNLCFNIISDEKGFYLKQASEVAHAIH